MEKITEKQLAGIVKRINQVTGSPDTSYTRKGDKFAANVGNYHLSFAYGGVELCQMSNANGGVRDVFGSGHTTKRDLANRMYSFLAGLETKGTK